MKYSAEYLTWRAYLKYIL